MRRSEAAHRNAQRIEGTDQAGQHRQRIGAEASPRQIHRRIGDHIQAQQHDRQLQPEAHRRRNLRGFEHAAHRQSQRQIRQDGKQHQADLESHTKHGHLGAVIAGGVGHVDLFAEVLAVILHGGGALPVSDSVQADPQRHQFVQNPLSEGREVARIEDLIVLFRHGAVIGRWLLSVSRAGLIRGRSSLFGRFRVFGQCFLARDIILKAGIGLWFIQRPFSGAARSAEAVQQLFQAAALLLALCVLFLRPRRSSFRQGWFRHLRLSFAFIAVVRNFRSLFRRFGQITQQLPAALLRLGLRLRLVLRHFCGEVLFDVVFPHLLFRCRLGCRLRFLFRFRDRFQSGSEIQVQSPPGLSFALCRGSGFGLSLSSAAVCCGLRLHSRFRLRLSLLALRDGSRLGNDAHDGGIQIREFIRSGRGSACFFPDPGHVRIDRVLVTQHEFSQYIPKIRRVLRKKRCLRRLVPLFLRLFRIVRPGARRFSLCVIQSLLCPR